LCSTSSVPELILYFLQVLIWQYFTVSDLLILVHIYSSVLFAWQCCTHHMVSQYCFKALTALTGSTVV